MLAFETEYGRKRETGEGERKMRVKEEANTGAEKKNENFLRLSKERVNKVIDSIERLENLSNKNLYSYTDEQVERMFSAIEDSLESAKKSFKDKKPRQKFEW